MDGVAYLFIFLGNTDISNLLVIFELHHFFPPENITKYLYHFMFHFDEEPLVIHVFGSFPTLLTFYASFNTACVAFYIYIKRR